MRFEISWLIYLVIALAGLLLLRPALFRRHIALVLPLPNGGWLSWRRVPEDQFQAFRLARFRPGALRVGSGAQADETPPAAASELPAPRPAAAWLRLEAALILSGALLLLCSQLLRLRDQPRSPVSTVLLLAGLLVFLSGVALSQPGAFSNRVQMGLERFSARLRTYPDQLVLLLSSLGLAATTAAAAGFGQQMIQPALAWAAWLGSIGAVVLGSWKPSARISARQRSALLLAAGLGLAALPLRGLLVGQIPTNLTGDEASSGLFALTSLSGESNNPFTAGWFSFPSLFFLIQSIPLGLFGQTSAALRLPSVLAGAATVGALYLLGRVLFNHRTGILAAALLGVLHFHIHFSRIGLNNIWDGLFVTAAAAAFGYGWKSERRGPFILAGLALGFGQYFYTSSRLFLPLLAAFPLLYALVDRQRVRRLLPDLALMFLTALVVSLPLNWFYLRHPDIFMAPMQRVSVLGSWMQAEVERSGLSAARILADQLLASWRGYADAPLRNWYEPGTPMLRAVPGMFFYLGIALLLLRIKEAGSLLVLMWLLLFTLAGGLSQTPPAAQRLVAAAPAAALAAGYGLARFSELLEKLWPRRAQVTALLLAAAVLFIGADELNFYFNRYSPTANLGGDNTLIAQRLAEDLRARPGRWEVYFYGGERMGYNSISTLPFLAPNMTGYDCWQPWGAPDNPMPGGSPAVLVFLPELEADLRAAQAAHPAGRLTTEYNFAGQVLYWLYELP